jgi:hypothetical protein
VRGGRRLMCASLGKRFCQGRFKNVGELRLRWVCSVNRRRSDLSGRRSCGRRPLRPLLLW